MRLFLSMLGALILVVSVFTAVSYFYGKRDHSIEIDPEDRLSVRVKENREEDEARKKRLPQPPTPPLPRDYAYEQRPNLASPPSQAMIKTLPDTEKYENGDPNPIKLVLQDPVSTFSSDVDTSSYAVARRYLMQDASLPPSEAIRVEEMVNYFDYDYALPKSADAPFTPTLWVTPSPWNENTSLMHIGVKGYDIIPDEEPATNIVLLLDVSGSMAQFDKLPLLKKSFELLVDQMDEDDTVSIVVYAGASGVVLEPTKGKNKTKIKQALNNLEAGGSTAGGAGIELAYSLAKENFAGDKINRVILATDGDFNVGIIDPKRLEDFIAEKRQTGIFLSILGFGTGNYNDALMQKLAQKGNGVAAYIDSLREARKVLVRELRSNLFPIATDLKFQVEFNPKVISEYRLIGYETRALNREDFNNDKVDAGDIGSGHTVTALYEITFVGDKSMIDPLRYGTDTVDAAPDKDNELAFVKMRYKLPGKTKSDLITQPVQWTDRFDRLDQAPQDAQFAIAVAAMGQKLAKQDYLGDFSYEDIRKLAKANLGEDPHGDRAEFLVMVSNANEMTGKQTSPEE